MNKNIIRFIIMKGQSTVNFSYFLFPIIFLLSIFKFLNLGMIPIFGDEALYLSLADNITKNSSSGFNSIQYGVFPLLIWIQAFFMSLFNHLFNPLILGRTISVSSDLVSLFLLFKIGNHLYNKNIGIISCLVYLTLPLTFFHTRFFLLDSTTNMFVLAAVYLSAKILTGIKNNKINLKLVFLMAFISVASFFTKPLAIVSFPAIFSLPLIIIYKKTNRRYWKRILLNFSFVIILSFLIILLLYLPVKNEFGNRFITDSNNSLGSSVSHMRINLWRSWWWLNTYLTSLVLITLFIISVLSIFKKLILEIWLICWIITVISLESFFSAHFYPRHLLPIAAPLSLLIGSFFYQLFNINKFSFSAIYFFVFSSSLLLIYQILFTPFKAPIALEDKQQFFEDWTSGVGNIEVANYLKSISQNKKIIVYTEQEPNQYWVYSNLYDTGRAKIVPSKELSGGLFITTGQQKVDATQDIYLILNRNPNAPLDWPVSLEFSTPKGPNRTINIYRVKY